MNIQAEKLTPRLVAEFGYTPREAELVANKLQSSTPRVQTAFKKWWQGEGLDEDLKVQGHTLEGLMDDYGFNPIAALLTMDWLIREPKDALQALNEGYDFITTSSTEETPEHPRMSYKSSTGGRRYALVVGVGTTTGTDLPPLRTVEPDAKTIADTLQQYGDFELVAPPIIGIAATTWNIKNALVKLTENRKEDDIILFYFAGHAVEVNSELDADNIYLVTYDFNKDKAAVNLPIGLLRQALYEKTSAGQSLIILDCRYSGSIGGLNKQRRASPGYSPEKFRQRLTEYFEIPKTGGRPYAHSLLMALKTVEEQLTRENKEDRIILLV